MRPMDVTASIRLDQATDQEISRTQPFVMTGAGALPLPTKQPPKLKAATTSANASATFFILSPLSELFGIIADHG